MADSATLDPSPIAPVAGTSTEQLLARACASLDRAVSRLLLGGKAWYLKIGLAALVVSLLVQTPATAAYRWFVEHERGRILATQAEHPLTPLPLFNKTPGKRSEPVGDAAHLEKVAFRLTIPILGKLLHTGAASWTVFAWLGGVVFFPLFAWAAARWAADRLTAAYLTLAFASTWAGGYFFNDHFYGDGLAWMLLLAAMAVRNPAVVFGATFAAAFTDERALLASSAVLLYWMIRPADGPSSAPATPGRLQRMAVLAAWAAYLAARYTLAECTDLTMGHHQLFDSAVFGGHLFRNLPYHALDVFKGLWLWFGLGLLGLVSARRWLSVAAYASIGVGLTVLALAVYDLDRSLGYLLVLLPTAVRWNGLSPARHRWLARAVCVGNLLLITPWLTPVRYVFYLIWRIPVDQFNLPD